MLIPTQCTLCRNPPMVVSYSRQYIVPSVECPGVELITLLPARPGPGELRRRGSRPRLQPAWRTETTRGHHGACRLGFQGGTRTTQDDAGDCRRYACPIAAHLPAVALWRWSLRSVSGTLTSCQRIEPIVRTRAPRLAICASARVTAPLLTCFPPTRLVRGSREQIKP